MSKDPVCGMQVDEKNAPSSSYQGQKVAFCGSECKRKFDRNPERYAQSKGQDSSKQKQQPEHQMKA